MPAIVSSLVPSPPISGARGALPYPAAAVLLAAAILAGTPAQALRAGQFLYVSGTTGRGDLADPQGMANALRMAYERIRTTLEAHDIGFDRVLRETVYTRDIEALKAAAAARREFYADGRYPASTWVQVDRLFEQDYLVEVELVAILP